MLTALEEFLHAPEIVILRGAATDIAPWQRELARLYAPRRLVFAIPAGVADLPAALAGKAPRNRPVAYVCRGATCSAPLEDLSALLRNLRLALAS